VLPTDLLPKKIEVQLRLQWDFIPAAFPSFNSPAWAPAEQIVELARLPDFL
jgi:hypothetical protein